ncbi:methionine ABC transporter ATP-binding protein [Beduinella massiliensis]|uniref:methionine ABC transporter ATP-binding protein n=1 Tax=Beduinella massiliensis TaxID=1852363 RepID=UPI0031F8B8B5
MASKQEASLSPIMIEIQGVRKVYPSQAGDVIALDGIDLSIHKGDIYGIIGMSGAGKSTLIRCINRLDAPTEGRILIDGENILTMNEKELRKMRRTVAMIFQQFNLLMQRTVLRNVCFPMEISGVPKAQAQKRAKELLEIVGLAEKADAYPAQLSGGQRQRVAIARALATDPKVLLCDEATSALDPMTTQAILSLLQDINKRLGITIVIITHEMAVIRQVCTRVAIIDGGRIAEKGNVREVFANPRTAAAKRLFRTTSEEELPPGKRCLRLIFDDNRTYEPVIAGMILACGVPVNILSANIQSVAGQQRGQMLVELPTDEDGAKRAVEYLKGQQITLEEVSADDLAATIVHDR